MHERCDIHRYKRRLSTAIARVLVGTGVGLALVRPAAAQAPSNPSAVGQSDALDEIVVTEQRRQSFGSDRSALTKLTETLRDTPQSITTLSRGLLEDQGVTSLNDALRTVPGITLGAGEFRWQGNAPSIRGFSARTDMYLDGLRDFGNYVRDPFDLERIEVLSGPSSMLFGRGSTGGAIDQVTKSPTLDPAADVGIDVGSAATKRATLDLDRPVKLLGDGAAFRLNVLSHRSETAGRDGGTADRYGLAPSLALGLGSATQVTLSFLRQRSDDQPDYGLPWLNGKPAPVPRRNYYGFHDDYLNTAADVGTLQISHAVSDSTRIDAQVRYADYSRRSRITEPLITRPVPPGTPLRDVRVYRNVFMGNSDETFAIGQLTATMDLHTGPVRHALVTGLETSRETSNPQFGWATGVPDTSLLDPSTEEPFSATAADPRLKADTQSFTRALYALDTLKVGDGWEISIGVRRDRFDTDYSDERFTGPPTPFDPGTRSGTESFGQVDDVTSYRAGVVYKLNGTTSVYLAGSTSFDPAAGEVSYVSSGRSLAVSNALLDPEKNRGVEVGVKSDVDDGQWSVAAAVFDQKKTNARIPDPANPGFNMLGGTQHARGLSLDLHGRLTRRLYLSSGYTYLDTDVEAPGSAAPTVLEGAPKHSISVWANYAATRRFDFAVGARSLSAAVADNRGARKTVPGYHVFDAMGRYHLSKTLTLKLNLTNLTDEYYFEQLHRYHVVPGPGFAAVFAITVAY